MTNDQPIEQQLTRLRPAPLPVDLTSRLLSLNVTPDSLTLSDRILFAFSSAGALAAAFILTLTLYSLLAAPTPPKISPEQLAQQQKTTQELQTLLATR